MLPVWLSDTTALARRSDATDAALGAVGAGVTMGCTSMRSLVLVGSGGASRIGNSIVSDFTWPGKTSTGSDGPIGFPLLSAKLNVATQVAAGGLGSGRESTDE